ncbi:MAG: hypothetical protein JXL84_04975 [Deltaproteobacteria bacterium]|nr:hypothetical protein [Deltaproteobacteria bacterium]
MSVLVSLGIITLAGCGVSKEDHEKAVSELGKVKAELGQANTKVAELEKALKDAQVRMKAQADKPASVPAPAAVKKPDAAESGMQDKLAAAQKEAADLRTKVESLMGENAGLKDMLAKLKAEYAEIQKKLGGAAKVPAQQLPAGLPKMP